MHKLVGLSLYIICTGRPVCGIKKKKMATKHQSAGGEEVILDSYATMYLAQCFRYGSKWKYRALVT
jgi:hypothetical protein